jgi:hypothetical protein
MNSAIFWDTVPCSPYTSGRFGETYHPHFEGWKSVEQETNEARQNSAELSLWCRKKASMMSFIVYDLLTR